MQPSASIFITDDSDIIKQGIAVWLYGTKEYKLVGQTSSWNDFKGLITIHKYPIVISTINWLMKVGLDDVQTFIEKNPSIKYIVIFDQLKVQKISGLLQVGIKGFINYTIQKEEFYKALEKVHSGNHYFASAIFQSLYDKMDNELIKEYKSKNPLTNREAEVLELISHGYLTKEIAERLKISKRTVDGHRANLLNKIGVRNTAGLVRYALGYKHVKQTLS